MTTRMMRVSEETHDVLKQLARERQVTLQAVLSQAVIEFRERHFFDELDSAYGRLAEANALESYRSELATLDATLNDGLERESRGQKATRRK